MAVQLVGCATLALGPTRLLWIVCPGAGPARPLRTHALGDGGKRRRPHSPLPALAPAPPKGLSALERNVIVLLPRIFDGLVAQHIEGTADAPSRRARQDHFVDIAAFGRRKRIGEAVLVFLDALGNLVGVTELGTIEDFHGTLRSHDGDLRRRPGIVDVA